MNKEKILAFIKERSESNYGTTKRYLCKEFKELDSKGIDKLVKELKEEELIFLAPLYDDQTGLLCGRGYITHCAL